MTARPSGLGRRVRVTPARLALLIAAPAALTLVYWICLGLLIADMSRVPGMSAPVIRPDILDPVRFSGLLLMWSVMMAAMMLPTAAPMIAAFARMCAGDAASASAGRRVLAFAGGYVLAWTVFSLAATVAQSALTALTLLSTMMMRLLPGPVAALVLVVAGLYQFTPLKQACLRQCRTPLAFLMTEWRDGTAGALNMGWRHGLVCIGCCWALMALLFVAGVMNALWIVLITAYVLVEKIAPGAGWTSRAAGAGLAASGVWLFWGWL